MILFSELTKVQQRVLRTLDEAESYATKIINEKGSVCTLHSDGNDERLDRRTLEKLHTLGLYFRGGDVPYSRRRWILLQHYRKWN